MRFSLGKPNVALGLQPAEYIGGHEKETAIGPSYVFSFRITDGPSRSTIITRLVNLSSRSPKAALTRILAGLAGIPPEAATDIDDSAYVGAKYEIEIGISESGWPRVERIVRRLDAPEMPPF
jgi:hypothetical protein